MEIAAAVSQRDLEDFLVPKLTEVGREGVVRGAGTIVGVVDDSPHVVLKDETGPVIANPDCVGAVGYEL